ncbi:ATPase-like, ParA/MinD [Thermodesulfatator indicus DSM 15286]|uniref:Iron-sulfur cluster carrier protein n=1 Tax=Thermodesulfatator indicus (strain DSM 15286 / JCM 11887 / CIR29812) TaxID=667014 RepID=F8ABQ8_THEID|nr:Mrp/NBP35 family ATP-binding protein [Thermodesulfatator indicus]AEH44510.1 ATPase-like, ParA/MinD [Thermodesulfatator indicus DSM 15286]
MPTREEIMEVLKKVKDPELGRSLVDLGMIRDVKIDGDKVKVVVALTIAGCPMKGRIAGDVKKAVSEVPGVKEVDVELTTMTPEEREKILGKKKVPEKKALKDIRHIIAVASGKGGVGKTTVSVNLAVALAKKGYKVGILDADIYGPNVPLLMGLQGERPFTRDNLLVPPERWGIKVMSFGFLAPEGQAIIWRGPLVHRALSELAEAVDWGVLDFLVIDLPPGTGDAPLTVAQVFPLRGVVIVTTPQKVALSDVVRSINMFNELGTRIFGIVENMSYLKTVGPDGKEQVIPVFGEGGGEKLAKDLRVPLLGKVPLDPNLSKSGEIGKPAALDPESELGKVFGEIAEKIATQSLEFEKMGSCGLKKS